MDQSININKLIKSLFPDIRSAIVSIIVGLIPTGISLIYLFYKNSRNLIETTMQSQTPLWASTSLVFLIMVCIYYKIEQLIKSFKTDLSELNKNSNIEEKLTPAFNVYWDKNNTTYCLSCKSPLARSLKIENQINVVYRCIKCMKFVTLTNNKTGELITLENAIKELNKLRN